MTQLQIVFGGQGKQLTGIRHCTSCLLVCTTNVGIEYGVCRVCNDEIVAGIKPCITLHHYTDPIWFAKKGSFEKAENSKYFVAYCKKMLESLGQNVHLWFTFNSPDAYAAKGYLAGITPPGKKDKQLMACVYKNMLDAHTATYHELKSMRNGAQARIGILKNI